MYFAIPFTSLISLGAILLMLSSGHRSTCLSPKETDFPCTGNSLQKLSTLRNEEVILHSAW